MRSILTLSLPGFVGKLKLIAALIIIGGGVGAAGGWYSFYAPNVNPKAVPFDLIIPKGVGYDYVKDALKKQQIIQNEGTFDFAANLLKYPNLVKPGKYTIKKGMSNLTLLRKLRSGNQDPVELRFGAHYDIRVLGREVAQKLAFSEGEINDLLADNTYLGEIGMNSATVAAIFIPNTYYVYYTATPREIISRMKTEYDNFWEGKRSEKAKAMGLSPLEVVTLASIVQAETYMSDERPRVAGVYINRLKKGMPLQADPTVIFANQDFTIKRVLTKHLEKDSPYNTYKYKGLPPGPINNPEISALDAVLNYEKHDYIYFCAKADFSGYHNFAKTLTQHNANAKAYHAAMNARKKKK
ncbi:MAG: endolytic transglycosylase MltG [Bacteroidia bacterium]|nr:endolytic transglycosylase MltG [Bacteroidia bacterium]